MMVRRWVWIMATALVLAGVGSSAAGIAYDLTKLKRICVKVEGLKPDVKRYMSPSEEAILNPVYVWLKGKLPKL